MEEEGTTDYTNLNFLSSVFVWIYIVEKQTQKQIQGFIPQYWPLVNRYDPQ